MRLFCILVAFLVACDASGKFELESGEFGAPEDILNEMEKEHPGSHEYLIKWANEEASMDLLDAMFSSGLIPAHIQDKDVDSEWTIS